MRSLRYLRLKFFRKFLRPLRHFDRKLEEFAADLIYDRNRSPLLLPLLALLNLASRLFGLVVNLRHGLYNRRILKSQYLGCMVITVGNLTVGGTGKTPAVEKIVRALVAGGRRVAILSRGYRSKREPIIRKIWRTLSHGAPIPPRIVSDGHGLLLDSELAGDEPFMLAANLPGAVVLTDKNRVKSGQLAIGRFGCDTLVLDDGFQYLRLRGQLNILLIDHSNPFGNEHLLPRGVLREPIREIRRASHIFLTKSDGSTNGRLEEWIEKYRRPDAKVVECRHRPNYLQSIQSSARLSLESLVGKRVAVFSGIAVPESFEALLIGAGTTIVYRKHFPDHYRFAEAEIAALLDRAQSLQAECVITTEKDAVRLSDQWFYPIPLYYLRIEIEILRGQEHFDSLIRRVCNPTGRSDDAPALGPDNLPTF